MEDEACKSNQLIIGKPADVICDGGYTNFDSGLSMEKYNNYHCEQTCNTSKSNSLQENAVNYDDNISNIVDGDGSERNQVYSTVKNEHVNGSALIDGSHGDTDGTRYISPYKDTCDVFHPKDGLDVVNETLSHRMKELTKDDEPSSVNYVPIPSTKLMAPEHLPNINMKGTQSDQVNHETDILQIENNGSFEEERNFYFSQNVSLKGDTKEINENIPLAEAECNENNADDKKVKSLELQTTSDNNFKKNWNLPKTIHQTSGIELIDAEELGYYFGKLFEFEKLTVDQEQNAVTPSEPVMEEADPILSALECLPYCVKGKNAKENKEWVLNPGGKTPVAILHEYSQAVLKEKPVYVSTECENPSTPFMAEVQINGITHGSGVASTKKQAKQIAAEVALEVLLPNAFNKIRDYVISREELEVG